MRYRLLTLLIALMGMMGIPTALYAQTPTEPGEETPVVLYNAQPKKYIIADIKVLGAETYDDAVILSISGLAVGQTVTIPGDDITDAAKRYWKHGLFSDVSIQEDKVTQDSVWLSIHLQMRPRASEIRFTGAKKSEREELEARIGMIKGGQVTPNIIDRATTIIKRYYDEKGFKNAEVEVMQIDDPNQENQVIVQVNIDKKEKIKVNQISFEGNQAITDKKLKRVMKKTNEKNKLVNIFRTKKFTEENYEADKQLIIDKYNELGYRDAVIVEDSVSAFDEGSVNVFIRVDEGQKYYLRNVTWVGNTVYPTAQLESLLRMKRGDVYNQKLLDERLATDDDAIGNLYYNNGYLFYSLDPVEVNIDGDSIDLEMRIVEGQQATINKIIINGNDRVYENVVRRDLYVRPGDLFNREELINTMRRLMQMGHFDPEQISPTPVPHPEDGTVDIQLDLVSKANDQIELSAGWGQTGVIGRMSLKFTNFSMANLLHPGKNHRGIMPQGDGQTLSLSAQTNGTYYQSYSISFADPWFGGKRPNTLQLSAYYSVQTDISSRYYSSAMMNNYYNSMMYGGMYGSMYGGYGMYNSGLYNYENYYDPDKYVKMFGLSALFGKRLTWPDDYFQASAELSYQRYMLSEWNYFPVTDGNCNNLSLSFTLGRYNTDSQIYPRSGSEFSFSVQLTPPYSAWDGVDYSKYDLSNQDDVNRMHKWVEYHKWKFKSRMFIPLLDPYTVKNTPVLMARADFGLIGHYNSYKKTPFETFDVGGDGMTGYSYYATENIALRGYENSSLTYSRSQAGYAYTRMVLELRYPLMLETSTSIYALAFIEGGNAWNEVSDFNPFDLKRSAGVGVRIFLPMIGMMGIDWAYGFDSVNGSKEYGGSNFHFMLGQEF